MWLIVLLSIYLPKIEYNPDRPAGKEYKDHTEEHHGDGVVPLPPPAGVGLPAGGLVYHVEYQTVEDP